MLGPQPNESPHMCPPSTPLAASLDDLDMAPLPPGAGLLADLVCANHILYDQGVVDAFGHVSVRHDRDPERFLLARNMAPGQVGEVDIVSFTLAGDPINAKGRRVYIERFIHAEIYRAHPQIQAIVHSHSPAIVPLSVSRSTPLRAVFHMAGFIGTAAPVFEIRDVVGDSSDLLVRDRKIGAALAAHFVDHPIVLMRGHGSTVVGESLKQAVYRAVYAEINARCQTTAAGLGEVNYLSAAECASCATSHEAQAERPWSLWKEEALRRRALRT